MIQFVLEVIQFVPLILHVDGEQDEVLIPSEYYNQKEYCHPQAAFQRKSISVHQEEFPPYPES